VKFADSDYFLCTLPGYAIECKEIVNYILNLFIYAFIVLKLREQEYVICKCIISQYKFPTLQYSFSNITKMYTTCMAFGEVFHPAGKPSMHHLSQLKFTDKTVAS
jgi:hypothetical protein